MKRLLICLCLSCACCWRAAQRRMRTRTDHPSGCAERRRCFFDYDAGGTAMQVIARFDDSGVPKLSYNTCQSCAGSPYAYFEVQDGLLVCRNCGNLFGFDTIGETRSGG